MLGYPSWFETSFKQSLFLKQHVRTVPAALVLIFSIFSSSIKEGNCPNQESFTTAAMLCLLCCLKLEENMAAFRDWRLALKLRELFTLWSVLDYLLLLFMSSSLPLSSPLPLLMYSCPLFPGSLFRCTSDIQLTLLTASLLVPKRVPINTHANPNMLISVN